MFFVAFGLASLGGVMLNVIMVPILGWQVMFCTLGCMGLVALVMNYLFTPLEAKFIPFEEDARVTTTTDDEFMHILPVN